MFTLLVATYTENLLPKAMYFAMPRTKYYCNVQFAHWSQQLSYRETKAEHLHKSTQACGNTHRMTFFVSKAHSWCVRCRSTVQFSRRKGVGSVPRARNMRCWLKYTVKKPITHSKSRNIHRWQSRGLQTFPWSAFLTECDTFSPWDELMNPSRWKNNIWWQLANTGEWPSKLNILPLCFLKYTARNEQSSVSDTKLKKGDVIDPNLWQNSKKQIFFLKILTTVCRVFLIKEQIEKKKSETYLES